MSRLWSYYMLVNEMSFTVINNKKPEDFLPFGFPLSLCELNSFTGYVILKIVFIPVTCFSALVCFLSPTASAVFCSSLEYSGIWACSSAVF